MLIRISLSPWGLFYQNVARDFQSMNRNGEAFFVDGCKITFLLYCLTKLRWICPCNISCCKVIPNIEQSHDSNLFVWSFRETIQNFVSTILTQETDTCILVSFHPSKKIGCNHTKYRRFLSIPFNSTHDELLGKTFLSIFFTKDQKMDLRI